MVNKKALDRLISISKDNMQRTQMLIADMYSADFVEHVEPPLDSQRCDLLRMLRIQQNLLEQLDFEGIAS